MRWTMLLAWLGDFSDAISETLQFLNQLEVETLSVSCESKRRRVQQLLENVNKQVRKFRQQTTESSDINKNTTFEFDGKRSSLETLHLKGLCEPHKPSKRHGHHDHHHHSKQNGESPSHVTSETLREITEDAREDKNGELETGPNVDSPPTEHDRVWSRSTMSTKRRFFEGRRKTETSGNSAKNDSDDDENSSADEEIAEVTIESEMMTSSNTQPMLPILTIERAGTPSSSSSSGDDERGKVRRFLDIPSREHHSRGESITKALKRRLRKYLKMEMRGSFDVSMVDLLDPDFSGWLIDQADESRKWCVINDMLFCVFDNDQSKLANDVFVLPACAVRELFFRSSSSATGAGSTRKYQIVIRSSSNSKERVFAAEGIVEHNDWLDALRHAIENCTDMYSTDESDADADSINGSMGSGYYPTPVKDQNESGGYNPTAIGSVTRDEKIHEEKTGEGTALFRRTSNLGGQSPLDSTTGNNNKAISTSEESDEEEELAPLPKSKPKPDPSPPTPQRRISYLMATEHQNQAKHTSKQSKSLIDKIVPKKSRPFAGMKMPRSPNPLRRNIAAKKEAKKVKVTLESLTPKTLATYLKFKDHSKVVKYWSVIHGGKLYTFKTKNPTERCEMCIDLSQSGVELTDKVRFEFKVTCDGKDHVFAAQDRYDFNRWVRELLPGSDVKIPNVALSSALRGTTESFCLDDGVRRSFEDLTDLRSKPSSDLASLLSRDDSFLRKTVPGTFLRPTKRFERDSYRRSTGHLLGDANHPAKTKVPEQRKSKDDTYLVDIIRAIHSNPLESCSNTKKQPDRFKDVDGVDPSKREFTTGVTSTREFASQRNAEGDSASEEVIVSSLQSTLAAAPLLNPSTMTLKVDLNLDPGTDIPVPPEALAYSAASESSDDDEKNIIADPSSSNASSWMNSSMSCGSTTLSGIYTDSARIEAKVIEYEIRQRRSGSVEKPQRGNIPAALLKRHSTDNILRPTPSLDGEMDQDSLGSPRQRSCSVNLPTDNPTRADETQRCGVVRSASSGSVHSGSVVSEQIVLEGQVEVVDEDGILRSFWAIYDDLSLALYPDQFAIDPEGLIAVSSCNVQMAEVGEEGQSAIRLSRMDRDPIFLYAGSEEATRRWHDVMKDDVTKLAIEGLNLEDANSREFQIDAEIQLEEEKKRKFKEDLVRIRKEQLLTELLQQKHDLELKQKLKSKMASPDSTPQGQGSVPSDDDSDDFDGATELQMVKDITYLKQRRISTQIKVDTIQKQLQESQKKPEKRLFKFALGKKEHTTDSNKKDHLESQFKELTGKLETINENLTKQESEQEKLKKQRSERKHLHNSFSSGDMSKNPALTLALDSQRTSDDLRLSASQPASSLSRPRALTSPPAVLQKQQLLSSLSANWAGEKEKRKSEPPRPKPKLEIDPTALAEIEEFEKMTKMFLSRHSTPGFRM